MSPTPAFIRLSRNPDKIEVRHRETGPEIAQRLRMGVPPVPVVSRTEIGANADAPGLAVLRDRSPSVCAPSGAIPFAGENT